MIRTGLSRVGFPNLRIFRRCRCSLCDGAQKRNKMSYFHQVGSEPLRQITVGQLMAESARRWPARAAVVSLHENITVTYSDAENMANRLASGFLEIGLEPGERLAILGPNSVHWYITMIAAAKASLVTVSINPSLAGPELEHCLKKVGVAGLVGIQAPGANNLYDTLVAVAPEIPKASPSGRIQSSKLPQLRRLIMATNDDHPGAETMKNVLRLGINPARIEELEETIQPDDPTSIQFSSGTTGRPKAAVLSHFNIVNNSYFFGKRLGLHKKEHRICLQVPLFHTFGSTIGILGAINHGATLVMPSPKFSARSTIEAIKRARCSVIYGTPTMYTDLCARVEDKVEGDLDLRESIRNVEEVVSGGATFNPAQFERISKTFQRANINSIYGMTESSPLVLQTMPDDPLEKRIDSVGRVSDHAEIKVVDSKGLMVPMGTAGEVWFRSYATMLGYWDDPEKTKEMITSCGWMKSGDIFVLREDGYGQVVGRLKDVIIRGGENIFPAEVEHVLETHPNVLEAQVYGVNDARMGEEVSASLKLKADAQLTKQDLYSFCLKRMARYKIPKYINFVEDFPKTESGKVKKFMLKEAMERNKNNCLAHPVGQHNT